MIARLAKRWAEKAQALAQTEPNGKDHQLALQMAGISENLPRNNLRIFTTPEDVVQGIWRAWRRVNIAHAEWHLCDLRRSEAALEGDEEGRVSWSQKLVEADAKQWLEYERLVRIPATRFADFASYKLGRWSRGLGDLDWMRTHKPELAAILDDESQRLNAEKAVRKAERAAKQTTAARRRMSEEP